MVCEKCKEEMNWSIEGATQGWRCPVCGWNIITTYIDEIGAYVNSIWQIVKRKIIYR
ncbi:MAG: hypothetical protein HDQ97_02050 [Lachnospiraceae bacterium]|nr:hypothetical protein [Lachnospiraceae bacterium]